jgi:hypothetical protein
MKLEKVRELKEVSWKDARGQIQSVNPSLAREIDKLSPSKDYPLFKATYLYGDLLVVAGKSYLPTP